MVIYIMIFGLCVQLLLLLIFNKSVHFFNNFTKIPLVLVCVVVLNFYTVTSLKCPVDTNGPFSDEI